MFHRSFGFAILAVVALWQLTVSVVLAQSSEFPPVDLVCYMQTASGETIDLSRLCGRPRPASASTAAPTNQVPLSPYTNLGGLEIYGRGNNAPPCFGLDDQGRPCPSAGSGPEG